MSNILLSAEKNYLRLNLPLPSLDNVRRSSQDFQCARRATSCDYDDDDASSVYSTVSASPVSTPVFSAGSPAGTTSRSREIPVWWLDTSPQKPVRDEVSGMRFLCDGGNVVASMSSEVGDSEVLGSEGSMLQVSGSVASDDDDDDDGWETDSVFTETGIPENSVSKVTSIISLEILRCRSSSVRTLIGNDHDGDVDGVKSPPPQAPLLRRWKKFMSNKAKQTASKVRYSVRKLAHLHRETAGVLDQDRYHAPKESRNEYLVAVLYNDVPRRCRFITREKQGRFLGQGEIPSS